MPTLDSGDPYQFGSMRIQIHNTASISITNQQNCIKELQPVDALSAAMKIKHLIIVQYLHDKCDLIQDFFLHI